MEYTKFNAMATRFSQVNYFSGLKRVTQPESLLQFYIYFISNGFYSLRHDSTSIDVGPLGLPSSPWNINPAHHSMNATFYVNVDPRTLRIHSIHVNAKNSCR